jgi:hypothetical protein
MKPVHTSDHPAIHAQGGGTFQSLPSKPTAPEAPSALRLSQAVKPLLGIQPLLAIAANATLLIPALGLCLS